MKQWIAGLATVAVLGLALWASRAGAPAKARAADTPDGCIQQMFAAAGAGDVDAYLSCFRGDALVQMQHKFAQQNRGSSSSALRAAVEGMKGYAVHDSVALNKPAGGEADVIELPIERVYAHYNELQIYRLRRAETQWQVESIRDSGNQQPKIPYGTPVF